MKTHSLLLVSTLLLTKAYGQTDLTKGTWFNQEKDSRIQFIEQGAQLSGKIAWLKDREVLDTKNPDAGLQKRPLLGAVVLTGFQANGTNEWTGGKVYDPKSGKTYSAKILIKNATTLELRGYVGSPMFGRTTVFTKAN